MPESVMLDLGTDGPERIYLCLPNRIVVIINSNPLRKAG